MKAKTPLQLIQMHKAYEQSFQHSSRAGSVTYYRKGKQYTYSAMSFLVQDHLKKTLLKIKDIHFAEFRETKFDSARLDALVKEIKTEPAQTVIPIEMSDSARLGNLFQSGFDFNPQKYNIQYKLIKNNDVIASDSVFVTNSRDSSKDLRRVIDTVYLSLRSKGINRLFWFRATSFQLSHLPEVTLNSRSGVTLNIKVGLLEC